MLRDWKEKYSCCTCSKHCRPIPCYPLLNHNVKLHCGLKDNLKINKEINRKTSVFTLTTFLAIQLLCISLGKKGEYTNNTYILIRTQARKRTRKKIQKQNHGYPSFPVIVRKCFKSKQPRNHLTDVYQSILETTGAS